MPQPTKSQVHVNRPLTNISVAFVQESTGFVARKVFPAIPVQKASDSFFTYPRGNWFRDEMKLRAPGTESAGGGYPITTDTYTTKKWALHKDVADEIRDNADDPINLDREAALWLTQMGLIRQEREWASKYFTTGVWTGSTSGSDIVPSTKWDNASGNPVRDVRAQMRSAQKKTGGLRPNKLVVTGIVDDALRENEDIKDRIRYVVKVEQREFTNADMAALFGIEEYLVCEAVYNSAKENATPSMNFIMGGDQAALFYAPRSAGLMTPSAGYTFDWVGHVGAGEQGQTISTIRADLLKADRHEIEMAFDMKVVASDCGVFFDDVLT